MNALNACVDKQDDKEVRASMKEGEGMSLEGAPALFVDGEKINGAIPVDQVWVVIDRALRSAGVQVPASTPAVLPASTPKSGTN
jgi:protein-disulfide isomerase